MFHDRVAERLRRDESLPAVVAEFLEPAHELGVRVRAQHVPRVGEEERAALGGGRGRECVTGAGNFVGEPVSDLRLGVGVDTSRDILRDKPSDEPVEAHASGGWVRVRREQGGEDVCGGNDEEVGENRSEFRLVHRAVAVGVEGVKRFSQRRDAALELLRNLIDDELAHRGDVTAVLRDVFRWLGFTVEALRSRRD